MPSHLSEPNPGTTTEFLNDRQKGSIILIVLMLLVIMSVIGISSTNTTVTENFIVRNATIRKQNTMMVDAVAAEALQQVLDAGIVDVSIVNPPLPTEVQVNPKGAPLTWVHDDDTMMADAGFTWADWYSTNTGALLNAANSEIPNAIALNNGTGISEVLNDRGELAASPPRYALAGWDPVDGGSLKMTSATRRAADILVEYMSDDFGILRLTVGVEKWFM